jgi:nitroreductase/NAD-dependent dihydropyrimidine dehydrogenase PreA subunit
MMTLFSIDETRCKQDGICAAECPLGIITWKKGETPFPSARAEDLCINCGHCVAVCPHEALTHTNMAPEDCLPVDRAMALSPAQTEHFLRARRSIRCFKQAPVEKPALAEAIRLACFAPSGHNLQPVRWHVISGRETVKEYTALVIDWMKASKKQNPALAKMLHLDLLIGAWKFGMDTVTRSAPTLVLAQGKDKDPTAPPACTIAMTYFDLAAQSLGFGTCWCGYFLMAANAHAPLAEKLGQDKGLKTYGVMMAGYPKYTYHRMPLRNAPDITWSE